MFLMPQLHSLMAESIRQTEQNINVRSPIIKCYKCPNYVLAANLTAAWAMNDWKY